MVPHQAHVKGLCVLFKRKAGRRGEGGEYVGQAATGGQTEESNRPIGGLGEEEEEEEGSKNYAFHGMTGFGRRRLRVEPLQHYANKGTRFTVQWQHT